MLDARAWTLHTPGSLKNKKILVMRNDPRSWCRFWKSGLCTVQVKLRTGIGAVLYSQSEFLVAPREH